jgi:HlyD family secretion protein
MIRDTSAQDRPLSKAASSRTVRRWIYVVVAALAVAAGIVWVARGWLGAERSVDRSKVRIARVQRGLLVRDIVADGRIVAANAPTLYAIAAGIVDLHVQAGDAVKQGQPLATIDSPELQSELQQEQATLAGLEAEVGRAGLDVEQGRSNAQKLIDQALVDRQAAARELERNQQVFAEGALPELELRRSEDSLKKAEIALEHARQDARLLATGLSFDRSTKQQALDRQRAVVKDLERKVDALVIRSPVDGQVGQLLIAPRANVAANAAIMTVVDLSAFELEIKVPDSFARDLALGMSAEIRSGTKTFPGRVRSVAPEVVDGHVASRLEFAGDTPAGLRQNQRLTARILIEERPDVLQVERGPFLESGGGNIAYVVVDGVAERRTVRIGAASLQAVEILEGAKEGDLIVVSGTDQFDNAERVRIAE